MRINFFSEPVQLAKLIMCLGCAIITGCSGLSALPSGSTAPAISATGWTNGDAPQDLDGKVIVLEIFATW